MKDLDKVVFSYLKKNMGNEGNDGFLVDIGEEEDAYEGLSSLNKSKQKLWTPPKQFPLYVPRQFERREWKKPEKMGPLVMTNKMIITKAMRDAINEQSKLKTTMLSDSLSFTDSTQTGRTAQSQKSLSSLGSYSTYRSASQAGDDKVVNFRGGQRGIMERSSNFNSLRQKQARSNLNHGSKVKGLATLEPLEEKKSKKLESHPLADYSNLKSIVAQLIAMMIGSNDPQEFEKFRKRARMLRKRPTFVGLYKTEKPDKRRLQEDLSGIITRYARERNTRDTAEMLLSLMGQSNDFSSLLMDQIDQAVEQNNNYLPAVQAKQKQEQEGDPTMAVHNMDLDWMTENPDYNAVALQYLEGHDKPTNLEAKVARTDDGTGPPSRAEAPSARRRGPLVIPRTMTWDDKIRDIPLLDMFEATPYVITEELVDEVIHDAKRQLKRRIARLAD